jgi:hypothetical protein
MFSRVWNWYESTLLFHFSVQLRVTIASLLQICDALKIDEKNPNALSMLGSLELQFDETWLTAKEHFRIAKEATKGDTYSLLQLVCGPCLLNDLNNFSTMK